MGGSHTVECPHCQLENVQTRLRKAKAGVHTRRTTAEKSLLFLFHYCVLLFVHKGALLCSAASARQHQPSRAEDLLPILQGFDVNLADMSQRCSCARTHTHIYISTH